MRVAIVGGGITGLTIADELLDGGHEVTVFEKGQVGGLAAGLEYRGCPGVYLDKFYHHIFTSDCDVVELIDRHGLGADLKWLPTASGLFADGQAWPFGSAGDLLRFAPLGSLWQRLLMGWNLRYFARKKDWSRLDAVRCREFFARRGNLSGYRNLWEPLLKQKFADAADDVPAAFLWGRIHPRARSRGRGGECLGYLRGGFQHLFLRMADSIRRRGGRVYTGRRVSEVTPGGRPRVTCGTVTETFDRVVWTAGPRRLLRTLRTPPAAVVRNAEAVEYLAVTQLILVMRRRQTDYYWLNNIDPNVTFGGLIEHTNMVAPENYGGEHILYVVNYHRPGDPRFSGKTQQALLDYHTPSLKCVTGGFSPDDVLRVHTIRDPYSSPLYDLGFDGRRPPFDGWLANVDLCDMSQVYPQDRNMNHGVRNARQYLRQRFGWDGREETARPAAAVTEPAEEPSRRAA